jgi:selenocysteine-specific elongation factor
MTIDLGFAFYDTPGKEQIAFVDVPGHERFVKNMIAGAGGIDVAMLVIAADDGWMPQSQEHFQVIRLLAISQGCLVINKTDLAEPDWLDLLELEVKEKVKGSFLEDAPVFRVSAETGAGFDQLRDYLNQLPSEIASRSKLDYARLYIDRSFIQTGIGGVVTGTLRGNSLKLGQNVTVWPSRNSGKIRSLQSAGAEVESVSPGHRTAVSITGVDKEHLIRGGVITDYPDLRHFHDNPVLALNLELLPEAAVKIENRRQLLIIAGTTEVTGEVRLLDKKAITPGDSGVIFFKPDQPLFTLVGDHYIVRLPTPMVTLGGGIVLDHLPNFPRIKHAARYSYLKERRELSMENLVRSELVKGLAIKAAEFLPHAAVARELIKTTVVTMLSDKRILEHDNYLFDTATFQAESKALLEKLEEKLKSKAHLKGLLLNELIQTTHHETVAATAMVNALLSQQRLVKEGELYTLHGRTQSLAGPIKKAYDDVIAQLRADKYAPPLLTKLAQRGKDHRQAIKYILDSGEGYKCGSDFVFLAEVWNEIVDFIKATLAKKNELVVPDLREKFGFSRKYAIPILEETDRLKITERDGDRRIKGVKFNG